MSRSALIVTSLFTLAAGSLIAADWSARPPRLDARQFPIVAWGDTPDSPDDLRLMKEAGLNVTGFCSVEQLDRVRDAGLACFVSDKTISEIVHRESPATDAEISAAVSALAAKIRNHPAALGVLLRDEPSVQQMTILGRVSAALLKAMPGKLPYVNLFPNYANSGQLGADTYEQHLRSYMKIVNLPYLSWDNYSLTDGEMQPSFYENLDIVRQITIEAGIPFWNCILANALFRYMEPSDATFSLQVYGTLAYGGRGIEYFTYRTPDVGNFRLGSVDQYGYRTATWDMMRRINAQLHALAPTMLKLHSTGVYHWPVATAAGTPQIKELRSDGKFLIGEFKSDDGEIWVLLVNKSLQASTRFNVILRRPDAKAMRLSAATAKEGELGGEGNWLAPGAGVLFRVAPSIK
jgi:hypothetical protein